MAGNSNSGRRAEKPFADALRMEIAAVGPDQKALRKIAKHVLDKAMAGDMEAIDFVVNRTDGKPVQGVEADVSLRIEDLIAGLGDD